MKSLLFLLFALVLTQKIDIEINPLSNETHGCIIKEKIGKCCWENNNGCCKPGFNQICTQAFRTCCKTKYYDEETGTYVYEYS